MKKDEKKKVSPVTLIATAAASVTSMLAGSLFGMAGTWTGVAAGSIVSGSFAIWYENAALKAKDRVRRKLTPSDEDATSLFPKVKVKRKHRPWLLAATGLGMMLASAAVAVGVFGIARAALGQVAGNYGPVIAPTVTVTPPVSSPTPAGENPSPSILSPSGASPDPSPDPSPDMTPQATFTGVSQ
jgi:hypothetical protein